MSLSITSFNDSTPTGLPEFSYAFQPIVDISTRQPISYEALIRGPKGESAYQVLNNVPKEHIHHFDTLTRVAAIEHAARLKLHCDLNLNLLPRSLLSSTVAIDTTIEAAIRSNFSLDRIVIEVTEGEIIDDHQRFAQLINTYRSMGLKIAIDDFGAGYSGLNLLANFQPDQIKIDMLLLRNIETNGPRQAIVKAIANVCLDLGIDVIAEGVETFNEFEWLKMQNIQYFQGYLFAKPGFEELPVAHF